MQLICERALTIIGFCVWVLAWAHSLTSLACETYVIWFTRLKGATENARPENTGLENDGQLRKESQGLENAGLEKDGPC